MSAYIHTETQRTYTCNNIRTPNWLEKLYSPGFSISFSEYNIFESSSALLRSAVKLQNVVLSTFNF